MEKSTEEKILEVARKQFVSKGYAATRTQDIADEAGINKAMLHYYFRTKEKLYEEIVKNTLDNLVPKVAGALLKKGDIWEKLEHIIDTYINELIEHPEIPIFVMGELTQKREQFVNQLKKRAGYFPAMQAFMMEMMQAMGEGKIRQILPHHLVLNVMGMTVFPFIAKPIFCTIMELPEKDFENLMRERKQVIMDFLRAALTP